MAEGCLFELSRSFEKDMLAGKQRIFAYAKAGRRADAEQIAAQHRDWPWAQALVYAGLGDRDKAIEGLQTMADHKDPRAESYLWYPEFAFLRGDARLNEIRREMDLPAIR